MSARRRLSARGRVVLATTVTLAITVAVLVAIAYAVTVRSLDSATDRALLREAEAYQAAMRSAPTSDTMPAATRAYLLARASQSGATAEPVLVVAFGVGQPSRRVISNSPTRLEDAAGNNALHKAPGASSFSTLAYNGATYRVLAAPVHDITGATVAVFEAALAVDAQRRTAASVAIILGSAGLIALALGIALAFWSASRALLPLQRMAGDAAAVTHAEPGRRIAYDGPADELGSLAASLNAMLDRLEAGAAEQRRFIADASHELRTPVAIVRGNVELLETRDDLPEGAHEQVAMIEDESARMARLLDDLLALARLQGPKQRAFQPLYVPTVVEELAARARMFGGTRRIEATCSADAWVMGDPDLIDQALLNIVRNAVAHTSDDGRIAIDCRVAGGSSRESTAVGTGGSAGGSPVTGKGRSASSSSTGSSTGSAMESPVESPVGLTRVRITISDDGPGIPPAELPRIFDRFYRASQPRHAATGGAGLGLAIARGLIELHDGTVRAENLPAGGACFIVELPRIPAP